MNKLVIGLIGLALIFTATQTAHSQDKEKKKEIELVKRACLDYVEGVYEVKPELIKRSVHPDMKKYGYWHDKKNEKYRGTAMTFQQLVDLAGKWNKNGRVGKDAPKKVVVYDVLDKTATAKLTAAWGTDYFHLVKVDGKWKIYHVLWQSPPATKKTSG